MKISIAGKNIDIGSSLKNYIEEKLTKTTDCYLQNLTSIHVVVSKKGHNFHTDIVIHDGSIGTIKSFAENDEVYSSFDTTLIKIEKQLRRYKHKILHKHKRNHAKKDVFEATKYIIEPQANFTEENNDQPITIAEKMTNIETLTVSEAIMKMDLEHLPALLFKNQANGRLNVVYYRADGNISWVDPGNNI